MNAEFFGEKDIPPKTGFLELHEILAIISGEETLFLDCITRGGIVRGYHQFATHLNSQLAQNGRNQRLPMNWRTLNDQLVSDGKNNVKGEGIRALILSENTREKLMRISQGLPHISFKASCTRL